MKHPALTRVFALIVAVLSLVMLLAGIMGIGKAISDRDESVRSYDVLQGRVDTYEELSEKLNGSPSYKDAMKQLEKDEEEHRKNANSQKDSLMEYTAAEAMMKEGKDAIAMMDVILDYAMGYIKNIGSYALDGIYDELEKLRIANISEEGYENILKLIEESSDPRDVADIQDLIDRLEGESEIDEDTTKRIEDYMNQYLDSLYASSVLLSDSVLPESDVVPFDVTIEEAEQLSNTIIPIFDQVSQLIDQYIDGKKQLTEAELDNLKKGIEIAVQKYELMKESEELAELKAANEQLKEDENKLKSTKVHILKNENIKTATDNGEDIVKAAKDELKLEKENYKKDFAFRLDANILMIIGGIAGIMGIFGAYEIKKTRPWLIVPVAICAIFAAAADGISMYLGRGQMYSALAAFIFGIIQLIIILPGHLPKKSIVCQSKV